MSEAVTSAELRRGGGAILAALVLSAAALRVIVALQPGLWADELFSLAIATGHSLEHAAAVADAARGDYVEPAGAEPAGVSQRYLAHETPPAGFRRVLRAVQLSDTSPPLYYLVLDLWLRVFGASDAALRLFSTVAALLAMVLLWSVARAIGGVRVAAIAGVLFALAPPALYYSGEGRMYALTWFFGLALARATLALAERGPRPALAVVWMVTAAAGLLTHYFLVFVWLAMLAWLALHGARIRWYVLAALAVGVALVVTPWYVQVPASLAAWRVTGGWLDKTLSGAELAYGLVHLGASLVNGRGVWGGSDAMMRIQLVLYVVLAVAAMGRGLRPLLTSARQLPLLWLGASVLGPVVFDVLRHTATSQIERYALPGLPAAMLVLALGIDHVFRPVGIAVLAATVIAWLPGIRDVPRASPRPWEPFPAVAEHLPGWTNPTDLVIVNSIPSGVLGVARYLDPRTPVASWVVQLGQRRMPGDAEMLTAGRCRIALVRMHHLGVRAPVEEWLHTHATFEREIALFDYPGYEAVVAIFSAGDADRCASLSSASHGPGSTRPGAR